MGHVRHKNPERIESALVVQTGERVSHGHLESDNSLCREIEEIKIVNLIHLRDRLTILPSIPE